MNKTFTCTFIKKLFLLSLLTLFSIARIFGQAPTIQAKNIVFSNLSTNSVTASWTNGNGTARAVFISPYLRDIPAPVNGITYTANTVYGMGSQIGLSGWYCLYNGTGNTVDITGLSSGVIYQVMTVEYDGPPGSENYLNTLVISSGNPATVKPPAGGPIAINSIDLVTSSPTNAGTVQYSVTFPLTVSGLTADNFALDTTGTVSGAYITSVSATTGFELSYVVTVNTGTGNGTIGLNLVNANGLSPGLFSNLPFIGPTYTIDRSYQSSPPPVINSFSPASGPVGTTVSITGTGFSASPASNIVFFGGTKAIVTAANNTNLTVTTPSGATYLPISVLNSTTVLAGYSAQPFIPTFTPNKKAITKDDFMSAVSFDTGGYCSAIEAADIDGDGKPDLVLANNNGIALSVLRNTSASGSIAAGSFAPKVDFFGANSPLRMAIGDLDGDGKLDVAVTNSSGQTINIFRNTSTAGSISFAPPVSLISQGGTSFDIAIMDMDGDGKPDIIATNNNGAAVSIWRNKATIGSLAANSFDPRFDFDGYGPDNSLGLAVRDLDGDGKPDIVISNYNANTITVFRNSSTIGPFNGSSFNSAVTFAVGPGPFDIAIGDLDGDGKSDLVVTNEIDSTLSVLRNTSTRGFITASSFAPRVDFASHNYAGRPKIGDLDGDGKPDLVLVNNRSSLVSVLRNTSVSGSITASSFAPGVSFATLKNPLAIAISDLDGDGKPDLAVTTYPGTYTGNSVCVLRNNPLFPPDIQATNVVFSNIATNSVTASWTNGDGPARAVFISAASTGSPLPDQSTTYTANPAYGLGKQIESSGWYCVYNGTGNSLDITGLSSGGTYRVMVVEYNGYTGGENYQTATATGNPANVTTVTGGSIAINSINRATSGITNATSVQFTATFATPVTGLTSSDFALTTTGGISGASITSVNGSGSTYTITVNAGTGEGTIGLNLVGATGLTPGIITPLPFTGQTYTIDRTLPVVTVSNPSDSTIISGAKSVTYSVKYSDANFNTSTLSASNVTLNSNGSATGTISVSGSDTTYTITISNVKGSGTLGISVATGTASDLAGNAAPASGPSATFRVSPVLSAMSINSGTLTPAFKSTVTDYTTSVTSSTSSIKVTPITNDPNATVTLNGGSISAPVNLVLGFNYIHVDVTTLDGRNTTPYTLVVTQLAPNVVVSAPNIAYQPAIAKVTGTIPFSINLKNTGGPVPGQVYGQVTTLAGDTSGVAGAAGYVDGAAKSSLFNNPQDMVFDASNNLYIADAGNNVIRKITPAGVVSTFAGSISAAPGFIDGRDTSARFNLPDGLVFDPLGNLYVADYFNAAIRKITPAGLVSTFYQSTINVFDPTGICFDRSGNLVVALQNMAQIVKISQSGVLTPVAGTSGNYGWSDGPAALATFVGPTDVKMDTLGNLFIADAGANELRKVTPDGIVSTFAGDYATVIYNLNGVGKSASFTFPTSIQIMPNGSMYVADLWNNDIRKVLPDATVSLFSGYVPVYPPRTPSAGFPTQQPGYVNGKISAAQYNQPSYIRADNTGDLYISEWGNGGNRIRKITLTGYTFKGPALPAGLTFNTTTGKISGTVTIPFATQTDTVTAYNISGASTALITLSYQPPSTIATLSNLVPSAGTLTPPFVSGTTSYTDAVLNATASITITPTATDTTATITVNGVSVVSGTTSASIPLVIGPNTITTVATAQDGITTDTYTVIVTRAAPSAIATLSSLTISNGTLTPTFASGTSGYTASVPNSVAGIAETPTFTDPTATITVNGTLVTSGTASGNIPLAVGPNTITTVVTAQDGTTTNTYTIVVTRLPSSVASLSDLTISQGTLSPAFDPATASYSASLPNSVTGVTETPTFTDPNATITVNGTPVVSGSASANIPLAVGPNTITTVVTAQDGTTTHTYTVVVTRAPSSAASLANLTINQGSLSPAFNPATTSYTASVSNSITGIIETPTFTDPNATITVNGTPVNSGTASGNIPLAVGPNTVTTVVTAQDGTTTKTYTIVVTRAASSVATLTDITVSEGKLTPSFSSGTLAYADSVSTDITSISVTATLSDPTATILVNGRPVSSGTASEAIPLAPGNNTITVTITAQDGATTDTYTITVYRGKPLTTIDASNILTPNGDGKNDFWTIKDIGLYPQNNVNIFDKAGRLVYAKRGYSNDWDGTFNGAPLAEGTYYYMVDLGPDLPKFKGYISILRN